MVERLSRGPASVSELAPPVPGKRGGCAPAASSPRRYALRKTGSRGDGETGNAASTAWASTSPTQTPNRTKGENNDRTLHPSCNLRHRSQLRRFAGTGIQCLGEPDGQGTLVRGSRRVGSLRP